ncbi:MAG: flagellar hook protein FlgE [Hydrogenophaga sp.]|jgi:flagellar hook protein FlgE|uniref:flagellar hook protein FlgE n=1 Tax=Hydrogenophaga sp. TaxID=1904254 RepID=UPI001D5BC21E|nr:flagellar hook protein FlgE [Hydrogenophaga sp.]MBW0171663.1 flagellar hook protein FlgE [Hydrogenophaga sp.]MBW0182522.1 flagellar hook protein FlgE [Hydrogenophaga sp.]
MAFQQGLSGLNSASRNLDVIGHNIANANTVGMKSSRAEFAELYASSINSGGANKGIGVTVATVSQMFTQGNITVTGNDLDLAINGNGFFEVQQPNGTLAYTRAGMFKLDREGNIINQQGGQLMGYPTDADGNRLSFDAQPLTLPTGAPIPARQTSSVVAQFNLDARAPIAASVTPPTPVTTYGTSLVAYDPQGMEVPVGLAFTKTANNTWEVYASVNGGALAPLAPPVNLNFNADGTIDPASITPPPTITLTSPNDPAVTFPVTLDLTAASQFGTDFAIHDLDQDGYFPGEFVGLNIDESGVVTGRYSNGETRAAGQVALVNFRNSQGLSPSSGGNWSATFASGEPVRGEPGAGNFGSIRAGALEDSNVDLTAELVNMMTAQRAYQANAQTIKTQDQVLSTLLNMR